MTSNSKIGHSIFPKTGIGKPKHIVLLIVCMLLNSHFSYSQVTPINAVNLKNLIHASLLNNTGQKIKREEIKIKRIDADYAGTILKPQVKVYSRYHWYYNNQPQTIFAYDNEVLFPDNGG